MKTILSLGFGLVCASLLGAAPAQSGKVYEKKAGEITMKVLPSSGCNVFSVHFKGQELLKSPKDMADVAGFMYGTPILYPTPNRIKDAEFTIEGKTYKFPANHEKNFIHGLVHSAKWKVTKEWQEEDKAGLTCELEFKPGTEQYALFPFEHTLQVTVEATKNGVSWKYTVDNKKGKKAIPFGFALHPWILYQGKRASTYLTVPATHWMESFNQLPSGKIVPITQTKYDATRARSLENFVIDDVYFGMTPHKPTTVDFRDSHLRLTFKASKDFTHLVVYTPKDEPWFCVENQTSSTDAHNLYEKGMKEVSHLQWVQPGSLHTGTVSLGLNAYPVTSALEDGANSFALQN